VALVQWPDAAAAFDREMRALEVATVALGRRFWRGVSLRDLSGSWLGQVERLVPLVEAVQLRAATAGASYGASALAGQGAYEAPEVFVDPAGFVGQSADGRSLQAALYSPVTGVKTLIGRGAEPAAALATGSKFLEWSLRTMVADVGRGAASVDVASRRGVGYIRMLNTPSCSRCVMLAGKFYRWNKGFQRHPLCDCRHIPSTENVADDRTTDPYEYFHSLSAAEQDAAFTKAGAQAIRDGSDMFQVVNSRRGMKPGGLVTSEGTSKRGHYGNTRGPRLTPDAIYARNLPREQTLRELERYGYLLPGGQNPQGAILGQREGFGALGRGGTRVGAREAVLRARETGVRDPNIRATMTAAERRAFDAQANWDAVREGRNPFGRGKLTPQLSAAAENDFRNIIIQGNASAKITARRSMGG
jgi:hypothetical protein